MGIVDKIRNIQMDHGSLRGALVDKFITRPATNLITSESDLIGRAALRVSELGMNYELGALDRAVEKEEKRDAREERTKE